MKYGEFKKILERADPPNDAEIIFIDDDAEPAFRLYDFVVQSNDIPITVVGIHIKLKEPQ
jgi:hypothetical protein